MELAQYAKDVIPHLKEIDKGYPLFWYNADKVHGFRLTQRGFDIMCDRGYKNYNFRVGKITSPEIILMDKKIMHPWHLQGLGNLSFFYEPMAIAMALSNNNVDTSVNLVYC
jgi:hypothetical protein